MSKYDTDVDFRENCRKIKEHPNFRPLVGMLGFQAGIITKVSEDGQYITTSEWDDEGQMTLTQRLDDGWLPDYLDSRTQTLLKSIGVPIPVTPMDLEYAEGCWTDFMALVRDYGTGVQEEAESFHYDVLRPLIDEIKHLRSLSKKA